jgi:hypothetical protein
MLDRETPKDMYRRLKALCVTMVDLGATYVDDKWIKRKFVQALLPYEEIKLNSIKERSDYRTMTSNDVLGEIIAMTIAKKNVNDALAHSQGVRKVNLTLKAKEVVQDEEEEVEWCPEETKYDYHEHMALAAKAFWGKNFKSRDNLRSYPGGQRPNGPGARSCYNCGDKGTLLRNALMRREREMVAISSTRISPSHLPTRTLATRTSPTRRFQQECWWFKRSTCPWKKKRRK